MDLEALYRHRFAGVDQTARVAVWNEISRFVMSIADSPRIVLDPACGLGEFINSCPADERWAMDVSLDGSTLSSDIRFQRRSFLDSQDVLPRAHFDLVFASNVLEHMSDQNMVNAFLGRARDVLSAKGRVVIMGPNFRYCMKEYFDCADHVVPLTHISVEEHLVAAGFRVVRNIPRFLPYSFRSHLPANVVATRAYLKMPIAWKLLGKQFLVVGEPNRS